jgi:hypothetical protein
MISKFLRGLWDGWDRFFFAPVGALPAGVFRFLFALNTLVMYSIRFKSWRFYFTDDGFLPLKGVYDILPEFYRPGFSWYPTTDAAALAMNIGLLACLILLLVGALPRLAALVGFILHVALIQRNYSVAYGADFITTFMFFSLIFIRSDRRFSLAAWWRARTGRSLRDDAGSIPQMLSSAAIRVMQIQLCLIYAYTGLEKMKGPSWWDGSAIWAVVGNQQIMFIDSSWIAKVPLLLAAMTFLTLLFEIYFAALVWTPLRKWIILLGIFMHTGIALSIGLFYFSFGMMCVYVLFADPAWLDRALSRLPQLWLGRPVSV